MGPLTLVSGLDLDLVGVEAPVDSDFPTIDMQFGTVDQRTAEGGVVHPEEGAVDTAAVDHGFFPDQAPAIGLEDPSALNSKGRTDGISVKGNHQSSLFLGN